MRLLIIAAACALTAAGSASAQTRGLAPTTSPNGAPAIVTTGHTATMPGPAARPATMAGSTMARPTTMAQPMHHTMMHHTMMHHRMHHGMRRHRMHSAAWCMRRAKMHHMTDRAMTHYIERCEAGRHHRHHGMMHHPMAAKPMTTTTTHTMTKPATPPKK